MIYYNTSIYSGQPYYYYLTVTFVVRRDEGQDKKEHGNNMHFSLSYEISVNPCRDVVIPSPVLAKRGDAAVEDFPRIPVPTFRIRGSTDDTQIHTLLYYLDTFTRKYHARYLPHIL